MWYLANLGNSGNSLCVAGEGGEIRRREREGGTLRGEGEDGEHPLSP